MSKPTTHSSGRLMDYCALDERFTPYYESGEQVEVEWVDSFKMLTGHLGCKTGGKRSRFYVGISGGWQPVYIMLLTKRSIAGGVIFPQGVKSIKGMGKYRK